MMQAGVDRVLAGEANAAVAAALGLNARSLNIHVVNRRKAAKVAATDLVALTPAAAPIPTLSAEGEPQAECRSCGKPMVVTVEHPDLCRRCRP